MRVVNNSEGHNNDISECNYFVSIDAVCNKRIYILVLCMLGYLRPLVNKPPLNPLWGFFVFHSSIENYFLL